METITKIEYLETESFKKDFKKLLKKYRSLNDDLEVVKRNAIELFHLKNIDNQSVFPIFTAHSKSQVFFPLLLFQPQAIYQEKQ